MSDSATPWTAECHAFLSFTISRSLLTFMSIELVMLTISSSAASLVCLQSFPASRFFFSELALPIRWSKYWSFRFNISPSNEYSVLISSRMDWFDLLVVQGTLKSLLQHYNSKVLILWCSAFFMVQFSHL